MAVDVTSMTTSVRTRLGNPSTDGFFTDAQILDLLNEGVQAVAAEGDWPWHKTSASFNTVSGTATYTPIAGWMKTRALTIDGFDSMTQLSLQEIREMPTTTTGTPCWYAVENEVINLRPVPNAVFAVIHDYFKVEPVLSGATDEPLLPTQFRMAIVEYAVYLAHLRQGDTSRYSNAAAAALDNFGKWIVRMADHRRRTSGARRIRVRPGSAL